MNVLFENDEYKKYSTKVIKINKVGKSKVYDIEVKDEHRLVANNFYTSNCTHPDIEEFINVKSDTTKIQNANISVQCTNDFYKAVLNNDDWELKFTIPEIKIGDKIYLNEEYDDIKLSEGKDENGNYYLSKFKRKKEVISKIVKAKKILEMIAKGMFEYAEPGVQNIDIARKYSNSDYVGFPIIGTNACCIIGESKILTNKGWLAIKEIFENKHENLMAMSYNIEKEIYELKPITNVWQQRNDSTIELEIEENNKIYKIECSADHKLLTKNRGYVEAKSLTHDDDILIFT